MKQPINNQIKIRKSWGLLNPATKRLESKKVYKRKSKYGKDY